MLNSNKLQYFIHKLPKTLDVVCSLETVVIWTVSCEVVVSIWIVSCEVVVLISVVSYSVDVSGK